MAKLTNPPLIEVIFTIRWGASNAEFDGFEDRIRTFHSYVDEVYDKPESLNTEGLPLAMFFGEPLYRFYKIDNRDMVCQIGPGLLSINYLRKDYEWADFSAQINDILPAFFDAFRYVPEKQKLLTLKYLDFLPYDIQKEGPLVLNFLRNKIGYSIDVPYLGEVMGVQSTTREPVENGFFELSVSSVQDKNNQPGIAIDSNVNRQIVENGGDIFKDINEFLNYSHYHLSSFFKKMFKGEIYNSFI